jgi:hypothetical protein
MKREIIAQITEHHVFDPEHWELIEEREEHGVIYRTYRSALPKYAGRAHEAPLMHTEEPLDLGE